MRRFSSDEKCAVSSRPSLHPGNIVAVVLKWLCRPFDFMIRFVLLMRFPFKRLFAAGAVIFLGCGLIPLAAAAPPAENQ
jgi:hypothetical protein